MKTLLLLVIFALPIGCSSRNVTIQPIEVDALNDENWEVTSDNTSFSTKPCAK